MARSKVKVTRTTIIVPCTKRADGCQGEVAVARLLGKHVVGPDSTTLAICPVCWTPRMIGRATASKLGEVQVPTHIRRAITEQVKLAELDRRIAAMGGVR